MPGEPPGSSDPPDPAGLVGRAAEAAAIRRMLDGAPLVTVTGLPGVGKTAVEPGRGAAAALPQDAGPGDQPGTAAGAGRDDSGGPPAAAGQRGRAVRRAAQAGTQIAPQNPHIEHIYGKIGVSSRVQLASWLRSRPAE